MATDERFDQSVSRWLEETAPVRLPERVLDATFERTRKSRQHLGWRAVLGRPQMARSLAVLGGAAVVVAVATALVLGSLANQPAVGGPSPSALARDAFLGTWISTSDTDGGIQTMTVDGTGDGAVAIVVTDTIASVCSGGSSTMTGTGRLEGSTKLVIPAPVYSCDDGRAPQALSGPPLQEQLRNLTYVHDAQANILTVGAGSVWRRPGAALTTPEPPIVDASQPWDPSRFPGTWESTAADTGFLGTWEATDVDGSSLLLGIRVAEASSDTFEVLLHDDRAGGGRRRWPESDWSGPLCAKLGTAGPITMTGIGRVEGPGLAIGSQTWICTDESGPHRVSGDRVIELRNAYAPLVHDPETDTLVGPANVIWHRRPEGSDPIAVPFWGVWPQSTLKEAEEAQQRADAGDPAFAWQLAPELATLPESETFPFPSRVVARDAADGAEILNRFFRDVLGWERYMTVSRRSPANSGEIGWEFVRIRCGPGTNPLYPTDAVGGGCPPTIGDTRYETVSVSVTQTVRSGSSGIWEVTGWTELAPSKEPDSDLRHQDGVSWQFEQAVPPTRAEVMDALEAFLSARVAGEGAEPYLTEGYYEPRPTIPLLYATTKGDRYERFEIADVQAQPDWPAGDSGVTVRLFARGGKDVVEQEFQVWPGSRGQLTMDTMMTTTENGVEVPDPVVSGE